MFKSMFVFGLFISLIALSAGYQYVTVSGCKCKSFCASTIDDFYKYDWCYTEGSCGKIGLGLKYFDYCSYPVDLPYEKQTAYQKQDWLWKQVVLDNTPAQFPNIIGLFQESVKTSFDDNMDVMVPNRVKYIHSVGLVAKVKFVPVFGHQYTGVFQGADYGLLRLSTAQPISSSNITPGFGLKFLRDGVQSANVVAMPSLDGQNDFNIWKFNYTNHVKMSGNFALNVAAKKFYQASNCPGMLGISRWAQHDQRGNKVGSFKFPYQLDFVPRVTEQFPSNSYDFNKFVDLMHKIPIGATLFDVYAHETAANWATGKAATKIGSLVATSNFVTSAFGDKTLFIQHQYMEDDFALRPEWLNSIDKMRDCGSMDISTKPPQ